MPSIRVRFWPVLIIIGAAAIVVVVRSFESFSPATTNVWTISTVGVALLLLCMWFALFAKRSLKTRVRVPLILAATLATLAAVLKIDGVTGNLIPRITWRWATKPDEHLTSGTSEGNRQANLTQTGPHDSPEFRGRGRDGVVRGIHLASDWDIRPPKLIWRQPIGAGWSSFAVVGNYTITQEQRGEAELVTCYELATGRLVWSHSDPVRFSEKLGGDGPRATPTIHEGRVYALGALGDLNCLDGATGRQIWHRNVIDDQSAELPMYGTASSPLIVDHLVIVIAGGNVGHPLVAYNQLTGQKAWSAGNDLPGYSSPVLGELAGQRQILIVNADTITGHDPCDGQAFWKFHRPGGSPSISQAVPLADDHVFISKGYGFGCALLKIRNDNGAWSAEPIWRSPTEMKTKFTNVVIRKGCVFGLDEGILECLDLATGRKRWKQGRYGHGQVNLVDNLLLVQAESGEVALVEADADRFRELARFPALDSKTWASPVLTGRYLLVRNDLEAACYELPLVE